MESLLFLRSVCVSVFHYRKYKYTTINISSIWWKSGGFRVLTTNLLGQNVSRIFFFLFLSSWECIVLFAEVNVWEWACESNDNWRAAFVKHSQGVFLSGHTSFVPLTGNIRASAVLCPCRKYCQGFCLTNTHTGTCLQHAGAVICTSLLTQCSCIATFGGNAWTRSLPIFCWILYSYY